MGAPIIIIMRPTGLIIRLLCSKAKLMTDDKPDKPDKPDKQTQLAVRIANAASDSEKVALKTWIEHLLAVKEADLTKLQKSKEAIRLTADSEVIIPTIKLLAKEIKRLAWDDRKLKGRLGIGGAAVGVALFGGQGAGIAALGSAIGVPLWVVFGAGAAFVGVLYEELTGEKPAPKSKYTVIDTEIEKDQ